ncbi:hypothetical protein CROQUDRAFT_86172 [Cronartium quercuum f. sp. fusiforme G11]|uniref:Uncharacterized protein n=1 Tax=Cronartium quercuum f. sp. fusiforme G11 TaxID=708437 RepID=A0A9P6NRC9_9BASI|nr:hypothetical protein CROQUDRAFT_86172 [Cronartium quercuum f. sp. fusiforme G11]
MGAILSLICVQKCTLQISLWIPGPYGLQNAIKSPAGHDSLALRAYQISRPPPPARHHSAKLINMYHSSFVQALETELKNMDFNFTTEDHIVESIVNISDPVINAFNAQGKEFQSTFARFD